MKKQDLEKKKKIKELIFKIIHSITYVLSALFIVVCIAVGVQSCNSKNKRSDNVTRNNQQLRLSGLFDNDYIIYELTHYGLDYGLGNNGASLLSSLYPDIDPYISVDSNYDVYRYESFPSEFYLTDGSDSLKLISRMYTRIKAFPADNLGIYYPRIDAFGFILDNGSYVALASKKNYNLDNIYSILGSANGYFNVLTFSKQVEYSSLNEVFKLLYYPIESSQLSFSFNNQINYNGYFNSSLSSPYIPYSTLSNNIDLPFFVSGGNIYNRIHLQFTDAQGSSFLDNTNNIFVLTANPNTYMTYLYMEYVNTVTGLTTLVNSRDFNVHSSGSAISRYNLNSSSWVSNNFKYLKFITNIDNNSLNVLTKFNSNTSNTNNGSYYTNIGLGNVFNLLSESFMAIFPLISIQIIPGLTIGLLLFLPLVVSIIILVFKAVKK